MSDDGIQFQCRVRHTDPDNIEGEVFTDGLATLTVLTPDAPPVWGPIDNAYANINDLPVEVDMNQFVTGDNLTDWALSGNPSGVTIDELTGTLEVDATVPASRFTMTCFVRNPGGSDTSDPFTGLVADVPSIDTQPPSRTVTEDDDTNFPVEASHPDLEASLHYEWEASNDDGDSWTDPRAVLSDVDTESITSDNLILNSTSLGGPPPAILNTLALAFTDTLDGPNEGWSLANPERGAAITIWGSGFGDVRGTGFVTIGGVNLTSDDDYPEQWGRQARSVPWLKTICFFLNDTIPVGATTITVTTDEGTSNTLPFTVRNTGRILFMDPTTQDSPGGDGSFEDPWGIPTQWNAPGNTVLGDFLYIRAGHYDTEYGGQAIFSGFGTRGEDGVPGNTLTLAAYPNEIVLLDSLTNLVPEGFFGCVKDIREYNNVSKFDCIAGIQGIHTGGVGSFNRIVGNRVDGIHFNKSGTGSIGTGGGSGGSAGSGIKILGNEVYNGTTGDRFDHSIYGAGSTHLAGLEIAYNYCHDSDWWRGAHITINQETDRILDGEHSLQHLVHHNFVDARNTVGTTVITGGVALTIHSIGDHRPTEDPAERPLVFNNILIAAESREGGTEVQGPQSVGSGVKSIGFYNNVFYNTNEGNGLIWEFGNRVDNCHLYNNIFYAQVPTAIYFQNTNPQGAGVIEGAGNVYYGGDSLTIPAQDTDPLEADPEFIIDIETFTLQLSATSPCIDRAIDIGVPEQERDWNLVLYDPDVSDSGPVQYVEPE